MRNLPYGLKRYNAGGHVFEKIHACGSGCITASSIPDLFGVGRKGKLALWAHVAGVLDMSPPDNRMMQRGKRLQRVAAEMYAEETDRIIKPIHARVKHHTLPFYASPDALELESANQNLPAAGAVGGKQIGWLPGEIKVVAEAVYKTEWQDGPPIKVLIQHQAQLNLTGAKSGPVIALVIGEFDMYIKSWDVAANVNTQRLIEKKVTEFLASIKRREAPAPDLTNENDQDAVIALARAHLQDVIDLPDEMRKWADIHTRYSKIYNRVDKRKKEAKAHLFKALGGHAGGIIHTPEDDPEAKALFIELKEVPQKERINKAHVQKRLYIKDYTKIEERADMTALATPYGMTAG